MVIISIMLLSVKVKHVNLYVDPVIQSAKFLEQANRNKKFNYLPEAYRTVVVMPFLGGAMGAGHSELGKFSCQNSPSFSNNLISTQVNIFFQYLSSKAIGMCI